MKSLLALSLTLFSTLALAGTDIQITEAQRDDVIKRGRVWNQPSWISSEFEFASDFDIKKGPDAKGFELLLKQDTVFCETTEELQNRSFGGKNPKFYCYLQVRDASTGQLKRFLDEKNKPVRLKVKYIPTGRQNAEVYGEVVGTRLLWALGFGADTMYPVKQVYCSGCTEHPYKDRNVDPNTVNNPRLFTPAAIEIKLAGDEIVMPEEVRVQDNVGRSSGSRTEIRMKSGWSFKELLKSLPDDPSEKYYEYMRRDALRLLAVFMHHIDLKADNQRILCRGGVDAGNRCVGDVTLLIHDIGSSFGVKVKGFHLDKMNINTWKAEPVWKNPAQCEADLGIIIMADNSMRNPNISDVGRTFLAKLLEGFVKGPEGRRRVEALFETANIETMGPGENASAWADVFIDKVNQIRYPMGPSNPDFKCPY